MPNPDPQDERMTLADAIEHAVFAERLQGDAIMALTLEFAAWQDVIAALRAQPERAAADMRERAALWHEEVAAERDRRAIGIVVNTAGRERIRQEAMCHRDSARAIRALPLSPAGEGENTDG